MADLLLTPRDVRNQGFTTRRCFCRHDWYDADEVDAFMERVETTLAVLAMEINELRKETEDGASH
ncbi:DivIVA domain-containing protein [Bifidobacterium platyrrhinorum]|uniref:Antigen 84 n=1 Tax=Bifidobacterium platyrrhinorum TaxID=2661628 RepID=A0A6L9SSD1_9BIFI|nr:DivIVA domain-containing protein [Bifidobacterium platyrrhinorum]NEG55408.1 hypothetical protein [Bifidobacterium platyrrhinorum]